MRAENVIAAPDVGSIYEVPLLLHSQELDAKVIKRFGLRDRRANLESWSRMVHVLMNPKREVKIAVVGKYVDLKESYKSLNEAIIHGGIANHAHVKVQYVNSELMDPKEVARVLAGSDGILVPGGFGERGVDGKLMAIQYAREHRIPFFGICYGMQLAAIEFARQRVRHSECDKSGIRNAGNWTQEFCD